MKLKKYLSAQKEHGGDRLGKNVFLRIRKKVRVKDKPAVR
jgi:hypothetical protein